MCHSVKDSIADNGIGEEPSPVGHCAIAREDDGLLAESSVDDGVEAFGGLLVDGLEAKIVDDQEVEVQDALEQCGETVLEIGHGEFGEQLVEAVEADRVESPAGLMRKSFGKMGFASTRWSKKKDTFAALNETARGQGTDELGVD